MFVIQAWDDVERKEKPVKEPYEYKKAQPINQEKSKMSLSEIYEKEYLQQQVTNVLCCINDVHGLCIPRR